MELSIPSYQFEDFRAKVSVTATAYGPGKMQFLQKTYSAEGTSQGAKMFWAGPFGMKSAIRQSSLNAYKQIFAALRADLMPALQSKSAAKNPEVNVAAGPQYVAPPPPISQSPPPRPTGARGVAASPQMICEGSICEMRR